MKDHKHRFSMATTIILVASIFSLIVSVSALADTYNFFFKKPGEKKEEQQETEEKVSETEKSAPKAESSDGQQTITTTPGQNPIVIHNINNVGAPGQSVNQGGTTNSKKEEVIPGVTETAQPVKPSPVVVIPQSAAVVDRRPRLSPWKFTLGGLLMLTEYEFKYESGTYTSITENPGGLFQISYDMTRKATLNLFAGAHTKPPSDRVDGFAGVDFQFTPFQLAVTETHDLIELGFMVGGSTMMKADGNIGTLHGGVRFNLNVTPDFGLTAAGRGNLGYAMFTAGLTARL